MTDQRPQAAVARGGEVGGQRRRDRAVEEQARLRPWRAGDVLEELAEVVAQQRVAAQKDEAGRAQRHTVVDRPPPLGRVELVGRPGVGPVVAVPAGAAAAVGDVQIDLAQAQRDGRLAARPRRPAWAARGRAGRRPGRRRTTRGAGRPRGRRRAPRPASSASSAAVPIGASSNSRRSAGSLRRPRAAGRCRRRSSRRRRPGRARWSPGRAGRRPGRRYSGGSGRAVAVDGHNGAGAGVEQVGEDGGEALSERLAALLQHDPARAARGRRGGPGPARAASASATPSTCSACARVDSSRPR